MFCRRQSLGRSASEPPQEWLPCVYMLLRPLSQLALSQSVIINAILVVSWTVLQWVFCFFLFVLFETVFLHAPPPSFGFSFYLMCVGSLKCVCATCRQVRESMEVRRGGKSLRTGVTIVSHHMELGMKPGFSAKPASTF